MSKQLEGTAKTEDTRVIANQVAETKVSADRCPMAIAQRPICVGERMVRDSIETSPTRMAVVNTFYQNKERGQ